MKLVFVSKYLMNGLHLTWSLLFKHLDIVFNRFIERWRQNRTRTMSNNTKLGLTTCRQVILIFRQFLRWHFIVQYFSWINCSILLRGRQLWLIFCTEMSRARCSLTFAVIEWTDASLLVFSRTLMNSDNVTTDYTSPMTHLLTSTLTRARWPLGPNWPLATHRRVNCTVVQQTIIHKHTYPITEEM